MEDAPTSGESTAPAIPESVSLSQTATTKQSRKKMILGSLTGIAALFIIAGTSYYFLRGGKQDMAGNVPIPTLALDTVDINKPSFFSAQLIGSQNGVEVHYFDGDEATSGFTALADKHNLFNCPAEMAADLSVNVAHGDTKSFRENRSWGYEYSGNESANKAAGKTGLELFDGRFWLSNGELDVIGDEYGYLNTEKMILSGGKRYYIMSSVDLRVSCMDSDDDHLNDGREDLNGNGAYDSGTDETDRNDADTDDDGLTDWIEICDSGDLIMDPNNIDTDGDGLQDGTEVGAVTEANPFDGNVLVGSDTSIPPFVQDEDPGTTTDPTNSDTDGGGLLDGEEDLNFNGKVDEGETDPNDPSDDLVDSTCGDGIVEGAEQCDDNGAEHGDGCSDVCQVEEGWECDDEPSTCTPLIPTLGSGSSVGSLFVVQDNVPTRSRQLLAGELSDAVLRLELRAEGEPIDVMRLVFTNSSPYTTLELTDSISRLHLYRDGESTAFAYATVGNCIGITGIPENSFCAVMESQQLVVEDNGGGSVDVLVRPEIKSDEFGAENTAKGAIRLIFDASLSATVQARGSDSSEVLQENNGDPNATSIVGNPNNIVFAKIASIEDVNPDVNGSNVPVGLNKTIAEFKFTAANNNNTMNGRNKASINGIVFNVASSNVEFTADSFDLFNKNNPTQEISCTSTSLEDSFLVECNSTDNTAVDLEMDSGDSITLVLEADITNNQVNFAQGSSLQVAINDFSDRMKTTFGIASGQSHIIWSDSANDPFPVHFQWIEYGETSISSTSYQMN